MNDLMTDSFVAAAAKAQQGGAPGHATDDDPELRAFLAEADAATTDMTALRDELAWLRSAHEASKTVVGSGAATTQAALVRLLGSARRLRARLASMDRRAPAPAAHAAAGLRGRVTNLTADVQALRRQVSAERRDDAACRYLAIVGDAPTEDQLDRLLAAGDGPDAAALLSEEDEAAEIERGLLELQQLFLDMAALVDAQGARVDDFGRHVAASSGDVAAAGAEMAEARRMQGAARRRRLCLAGGAAALVLVAVALAVVAALVLARRRQQAGNLLQLPLAAGLPAR
jgi:syntaxin 1B/2/3